MVIENGAYICFDLIESRYKDKKLSEVETLKESQKSIVKTAASANIQAQIDLASYIETIAATSIRGSSTSIKGIRSNRQKEQAKTYVDYVEKVGATDE